ncbi:hypothetical protein CF319_g2092 [Tilletia indica]|nr:hypothetical protein CF319_g2092 [Tilletia indica]
MSAPPSNVKNPQLGSQSLPGHQEHMATQPCNVCLPAEPSFTTAVAYKPAKKLEGKVVLISGGDSGIGRATAILCALEGAAIVIIYKSEDKDAEGTLTAIRTHCGPDHPCEAHKIDISNEKEARECVERTVAKHGRIDILFNNAGVNVGPVEDVLDVESEGWLKTFDVNIHGLYFLTKAAIPHMKPGASIINNASVSAFIGSGAHIDDASTKGAIIAFTRSLSTQILQKRGIRVNAIAPGSILTPLIETSLTEEQKKGFGKGTPMGRPGQPSEIAACVVFLASPDSSYISGSTLHPNGGEPTNA